MTHIANLPILMKVSLITFLGLSASGCASSLIDVSKIDGDGYTVLSGTAASRYAFIREGVGVSSICSEPTTDVGVDEGGDFSLSLAIVNNNDNADGALGASEVSLGGRSVNVLLTREIFFRTCEFLANSNLTDAEKIDLYKTTLQTVQSINQVNFGPGSSNNATLPSLPQATQVPSATPITVTTDN